MNIPIPAMAFAATVRALSDCRMDFSIAAWDCRKFWRTSFAWGIKKNQSTLDSYQGHLFCTNESFCVIFHFLLKMLQEPLRKHSSFWVSPETLYVSFQSTAQCYFLSSAPGIKPSELTAVVQTHNLIYLHVYLGIFPLDNISTWTTRTNISTYIPLLFQEIFTNCMCNVIVRF